MDTVFVVYSRLDENYGMPFKVFRSREKLDEFLSSNKDQWGSEYCYEELEVE